MGRNTSTYRIWPLLLLVMLVLAGILIGTLYRDARRRAIDDLNTNQQTHARLAVRGIQTFFADYIAQLQVLVRSSDIIHLNEAGKRRMEDFIVSNSSDILGISRIAADGRIRFTLPFREAFIQGDVSPQKHFQTVKKTGRPAISDVITLLQGYRAVVIHVPVFRDGRFDGVLGISISFERIAARFLDVIRVGETGYAWMISQEGIELYCPVPGHVGRHIFETAAGHPDLLTVATEMLAGREGVATYSFDRVRDSVHERVRKHAVYLPVQLQNTFWAIAVATPEDEILAGMTGFTHRLVLLMVFLLGMTTAFSYAGFKAWGIVREEEKRRHVEERLAQSEEKYRSLFEHAQEGIFRATPEGTMVLANQALASILGYASPAALIDAMTDAFRQLFVDPREGEKFAAQMAAQELVRGYQARVFRRDGSRIWVSLTVHAVYDKGDAKRYYEGIVEDITERQERFDRLRKALDATVQAVALTVEARDPTTAGHQRRVTQLARAIAEEMAIPPDRIDGLRMAAAIHDVGKVAVPAEILGKPTHLSDTEFCLVQVHPQAGHEILKEIDFPWPVARMVREHHERFDGSGYPAGLTGEALLQESRILAVADVVESMLSHRPYRPALGIDAALDEMVLNRGRLYDPAVVDACLRLFREKGYRMGD